MKRANKNQFQFSSTLRSCGEKYNENNFLRKYKKKKKDTQKQGKMNR